MLMLLVYNMFLSPWLLTSCLVLILATFLILRKKENQKLNLPPGPKGLPLVGFLPFFEYRKPHLQLDSLRKTYGNIFGMYMCNTYYLILNDLESIKEAFNLDEFTRRPDGCFQLGDGCTNFASTYGQHWVDHRRLASKCLRQGINSGDLETITLNCSRLALDRLGEESAKHPEGQVNLLVPLMDAVNGVSYKMVYGRNLPSDDHAFRLIERFQAAFAEHSTSISLDRTLPWLKPLFYLLFPSKRRVYKAFRDMESYCWSEIEKKEKEQVDEPKGFMECYLNEMKKTTMVNRLTRPYMNGDTQVLMFASGDTTRYTLVWFLLTMAKYPDIQEKVYREIHNYLGSSGVPTYNGRDNLPYTEATILESMRHITLVPLSPIHSTAKNSVTKFRGWDIPGNTVVIANLWSVHNDPKYWRHPDRFYPEHFLTPDGKEVVVPESFVPFSIGKRICIGDKMALVVGYLFSVVMLQRFQMLPPEGGLRFDENLSVIVEALHPVLRLAPRSD